MDLQRDTSRRHVDMSRPPPSAPTPKLSGTNSMPIGGRGNRFGDSASISPHPPLPSASFLPLASSASRRGVHVSGSNAQPVVSRPVRQPTGAMDNHDRLVCFTSISLRPVFLTYIHSLVWMISMIESVQRRFLSINVGKQSA